MTIGLHNLKPAEGSTHRRKRIGRGIGSGHGKTSTRGHKGNSARGQINPNFEGGQTPLHRRLPHLRGFKAVNKQFYAIVNLDDIAAKYDEGAEITPHSLVMDGLIPDVVFLEEGYGFRPADKKIKVLGDGEVTRKYTVSAHRFSQSAQDKITAAGGTVIVLAAEARLKADTSANKNEKKAKGK